MPRCVRCDRVLDTAPWFCAAKDAEGHKCGLGPLCYPCLDRHKRNDHNILLVRDDEQAREEASREA